MPKTLVGPQLRQLRRSHNQTQAEMAARLGVSPAYVNLLEHNQRSLSVTVLMKLIEAYGVDLRELMNDRNVSVLADLRSAMSDPLFGSERPDLQELRAAIDHAPRFVDRFMSLYRGHRTVMDTVMRLGGAEAAPELLSISPELAIHDFFRDNRNYFEDLETAADGLRAEIGEGLEEAFSTLRRFLLERHEVRVEIAPLSAMPETLRLYDARAGVVTLSEVLDHANRAFQLAHVLALLEAPELVDALTARSGIELPSGRARCRVELANYFASAVLMPYDEIFALAEETGYDVDKIAVRFGVSFEQVCQRLSTLQRDGSQGVPFFFLRIDRAGNVTKRFSATAFSLAENGGACPVWNIHDAFRVPGTVLTQLVEMPEGARYFTFCRTADRPLHDGGPRDRKLVVALGCEEIHAPKLAFARGLDLSDPAHIGRIGLSCQLCPRQACTHRAHQPLHIDLPIDENRRGATRYES